MGDPIRRGLVFLLENIRAGVSYIKSAQFIELICIRLLNLK
ncbi:hypothetical protein P20652_0281 [Pseudoalteromonas sp. BSi20652]|nr:hypothetical protein P20652_0281 [Pseudoalteromonas sp. BSi20652]GAA68334.1 hypothetical protein P20429_2461 [Pseudoalteromonas sp. BSi20429]